VSTNSSFLFSLLQLPSGLSSLEAFVNGADSIPKDTVRASPLQMALGEIEVSFAIFEVYSLPRLLSLVCELRNSVLRSSKIQEGALASLAGTNANGGKVLSGAEEISGRMLNLRKSALENTQRQLDSVQTAYQHRKYALARDGPAFPSVAGGSPNDLFSSGGCFHLELASLYVFHQNLKWKPEAKYPTQCIL
jgi:hypothetical protein